MNPPAFPQINETSGMSLRAYFAGQVISAVVRQCASDLPFLQTGQTTEEYFAQKAYMIADAPLIIEDDANVSIGEIRGKARRVAQRFGTLGLVVVN